VIVVLVIAVAAMVMISSLTFLYLSQAERSRDQRDAMYRSQYWIARELVSGINCFSDIEFMMNQSYSNLSMRLDSYRNVANSLEKLRSSSQELQAMFEPRSEEHKAFGKLREAASMFRNWTGSYGNSLYYAISGWEAFVENSTLKSKISTASESMLSIYWFVVTGFEIHPPENSVFPMDHPFSVVERMDLQGIYSSSVAILDVLV